MSMTIHCDIVSAEEEIFSGLIEMMVATGDMGELGVTYGHAPLLTSLKPGPVRVVTQDGEEHVFYVSGGFLEVPALQGRFSVDEYGGDLPLFDGGLAPNEPWERGDHCADARRFDGVLDPPPARGFEHSLLQVDRGRIYCLLFSGYHYA